MLFVRRAITGESDPKNAFGIKEMRKMHRLHKDSRPRHKLLVLLKK